MIGSPILGKILWLELYTYFLIFFSQYAGRTDSHEGKSEHMCLIHM